MLTRTRTVVIQGGMGMAVSSWRLASAVSRAGQLGVVSGTGVDLVLARRLQDGDLDGSVRRALSHFPIPEVATRLIERYYLAGGRAPGASYTPVPRLALNPSRHDQELTVAGNFVEVWLAKEGHDGPVGVNYLEKIQMATAAGAYGAMLAGVDYVLMGAGIPREIPHLLDCLAAGLPATIHVDVHGATEQHARRHRPGRVVRRRAAGARAAAVPRDRLVRHPRGVPGPRRGDPARRVRRRRPRRRRPQRSAARQDGARRRGRAGLRPARRCRTSPAWPSWACRSGSPARTARRTRSPRPCRPAPPASRSARSSRSAPTPA